MPRKFATIRSPASRSGYSDTSAPESERRRASTRGEHPAMLSLRSRLSPARLTMGEWYGLSLAIVLRGFSMGPISGSVPKDEKMKRRVYLIVHDCCSRSARQRDEASLVSTHHSLFLISHSSFRLAYFTPAKITVQMAKSSSKPQ